MQAFKFTIEEPLNDRPQGLAENTRIVRSIPEQLDPGHHHIERRNLSQDTGTKRSVTLYY